MASTMNGSSSRGSLEMEPALSKPQQSQQPRARSPVEFCQSLWALVLAYVTHYSTFTYPILVVAFILCVILSLDALASHAKNRSGFHPISHDYSRVPSLMELKMAQIDHWCLQGGDSDCRCVDPTEPMPHEEAKGWIKAHRENKKAADDTPYGDWDVVLLGDEFVNDFGGSYFTETFTKEGGGDVDAVALGISGDMISNLLWRIQHGELPDSKVYWIHIGTNDFIKGQCSEEAVLLGILRLAEEIHDRKPYSVIVINSILPVSPVQKGHHPSVWPAIESVNQQLEAFCVNHEHLVYFDATPFFVNSVLKRKNGAMTLRLPLYEQDRFHLSSQGHKVWGNAILERLKLILYEDDESSS